MNITFHQKGITIGDAQKDYTEKKIEALSRYKVMEEESVLVKVDVEFFESRVDDKNIFMAVTVHVPAAVLRAETEAYSVEEAADLCEQKLVPQLDKYKETH